MKIYVVSYRDEPLKAFTTEEQAEQYCNYWNNGNWSNVYNYEELELEG